MPMHSVKNLSQRAYFHEVVPICLKGPVFWNAVYDTPQSWGIRLYVHFNIKQDCLSIEDGPPANVCTAVRRFCSCDLDLDLMKVIHELDLYIPKTYPHTKMRFLGQGFQELEPKQTDARDLKHYHTAFTGDNNLNCTSLQTLFCSLKNRGPHHNTVLILKSIRQTPI